MAQPGRPRPIPRDARRIPVPAVALDHWLSEINDPGELKVTLRIAGLVALRPARRASPPSVSLEDVLDDATLRLADELGNDDAIRRALAQSLRRGTLAGAQVGGDTRIWVNDEQVAEYLAQNGLTTLGWSDIVGTAPVDDVTAELPRRAASNRSRANIFALYEEHIGTFGHGMAEQLRSAEEEYPTSWIEHAFTIASDHGVRSWGYVHAILRRWLQEGKPVELAEPRGTPRERRHDDGEPGHDTSPDSRTGYLESYRRRYGRLPWDPDPGRDRNGD